MKANLKFTACLAAGMSAFGCITVFGGSPGSSGLHLIDRLNEAVQRRFQDPAPASLGMSRVVAPPSFGSHFQPNLTLQRDFQPESLAERDVIAALERGQTEVGFYLFGAAITDSDPSYPNFRALKGPGAMTRGTPRPAWYPQLAKTAGLKLDTLPDWNAIYPIAREAMKNFRGGGKGFESKFGAWTIAARPVAASSERCVTCHNNQAYKSSHEARLGQPIGGVLYAFRQVRH
jgi:hypothetical protein